MCISNSELYKMKTDRSFLYNIMPIKNIPSVISNGLLCYDLANNCCHTSIALSDVQSRRDKVKIPGGLRLHQYASLYFTYHNPMLYLRKNIAESLSILVFSIKVLDISGCVVTDRNAATDMVRFYTPADGIYKIDFNRVFSKYWTHPESPFEQQNHKAIKCAEVLVPNKINYDFIVGAYVHNDKSKQQMLNFGFNKPISVNPKQFFTKGE